MKKLNIDLPKACLVPKEFFYHLYSYLRDYLNTGNDLESSLSVGDIKWLGDSNTAILSFYMKYKQKRTFQKDQRVEAFLIFKIDKGWDWIEMEYEGIDGRELESLVTKLKQFVVTVVYKLEKIFGQYNPSMR